ncbi:MAG: L,D-transpeptidase family protein [Planctomycetaceae bacterium]
MKSWIFWILAGLGAYLVYGAWFRGDEGREREVPPLGMDPSRPDDQGGAVPGASDAPPAPPRDRTLLDDWRDAVARGDRGAAQALGDRILREAAGSPDALQVSLERGRERLRASRAAGRGAEGLQLAQEARLLLTPALFEDSLPTEERASLRKSLAELAQEVVFSPRHVESADFSHTVRRGDTLDQLCKKLFRERGSRVEPGLLCEINGIQRPQDLQAGAVIKVPLGEASIVVVKREFRLYFLQGGAYVREFAVGLGRAGLTPEATFVVEDKMINPDWYPRPGVKIPYGDPGNILGTRWLGFRNTEQFRGFGIHGTKDPSSIGREESSGCVRMHQEDVERLFSWTPAGTTVRILR